jgi:hypothetical protein
MHPSMSRGKKGFFGGDLRGKNLDLPPLYAYI